jgi:hypothetical protein
MKSSDWEECDGRIIWRCVFRKNERVSKCFRTVSITKHTLTIINTRWEATQKVMQAKLTRMTHKIARQLHQVTAVPFAFLVPGGQSGNFWIYPRRVCRWNCFRIVSNGWLWYLWCRIFTTRYLVRYFETDFQRYQLPTFYVTCTTANERAATGNYKTSQWSLELRFMFHYEVVSYIPTDLCQVSMIFRLTVLQMLFRSFLFHSVSIVSPLYSGIIPWIASGYLLRKVMDTVELCILNTLKLRSLLRKLVALDNGWVM